MRKRSLVYTMVLLGAGIIIGVIAVSKLGWLPQTNAESPPVSLPSSQTAQYDIGVVKDLNAAFIAIAQKANPSVVTIFTNKVVRQRVQGPYASPFFSDPFREFFGGPRRQAPEREQLLQGMGSGVIISRDGYILTNNHVAGDADEIQVVLLGGKKIRAKLIGADVKTDIAVIKIEEKSLQPMELGNSDDLHVGEWVLAIGSPLSENLAHSVTAGIVSAKGRSNVGLADYEDFIQTDAAINPGNSGGALINLEGKLVGINTAIASRTGGFQGIGFTVPINMARRVMDSLIKEGKVVRGWLGVVIQDVDENLAKAMNLPAAEGVLVADVVENGPAGNAGIKAGDVILELDGERIKNVVELRNKVASTAPRTEVQLTILKDGEKQTVEMTLGELPEESARQPAQESLFDRLGFRLQALDENLARNLGYDPREKGLVVTDISRSGSAYAAGLRQGDLIKEVNRKRVVSVNEFTNVITKLPPGSTVLVHARQGRNHFFVAFALK